MYQDIENRFELSNLTSTELQQILSSEIEKIFVANDINSKGGSCRSKFLATIAIAAGVAAGGHYACNFGAAAGPVGFFGCHAAVIVVQNATNYLAQLNYEECMGN